MTNADHILCLLAAASLPKGVPLMHTQEKQAFVIEVAPEGSLQGFQIPYIEGRQPGALHSKRAMQPLLATGLGKRQHSNVAHEWIILAVPLRRGGLHRKHVVPAAWSTQNNIWEEPNPENRRAFTQILQGMTSDHSCRRTDEAVQFPTSTTLETSVLWSSPSCT